MSRTEVEVPSGFGWPANPPTSPPVRRPAATSTVRTGPPPTLPVTLPAIPAICAPRLIPATSTPQSWSCLALVVAAYDRTQRSPPFGARHRDPTSTAKIIPIWPPDDRGWLAPGLAAG